MIISQPGALPATTLPTDALFSVVSTIGVGVKFARNDHAHGLGVAPPATPTAETFGVAGAAGTGDVPARADHVHAMPHVERVKGLNGSTAWTFAVAFAAAPVVVATYRGIGTQYATYMASVSTTAAAVRSFDTTVGAPVSVTCDAIAMEV